MKEKIDDDFLRQTSKNIEKGNMEYQKYFFRLLLVNGTIKDRQRAVNEFEDKLDKMEIRKGNVDLRIEMLCTVGDVIKFKSNVEIDSISSDEKFSVVFIQSGKELKDEHEE